VFKSSFKFIVFLISKIQQRDHYTALFKGSMVLLTLSLIVLNQLSTINTIETEALKSKFSTEMQIGKKIENFEDYQCKIKTKSYVDCKIAKTQFLTLNSSVKMILQIFQLSIYLAGITLGLSICGYMSSVFDEFSKET